MAYRFHNEVDEVVTAGELNLWLGNLEATSGVDQINVILDACFSGSFIDLYQSEGFGLEEVSGRGRVVAASTTSRLWAYAPPIEPEQPAPVMYFSDGFWHALGNSQDLWNAFLAGRATVEAAGQVCGDYAYSCQRPWLDDTGDAWFDGDDGQVARGRGLAASFGAGVAPYIDWVTVGAVENSRAVVRTRVRDDGNVEQVWAGGAADLFTTGDTQQVAGFGTRNAKWLYPTGWIAAGTREAADRGRQESAISYTSVALCPGIRA